MAVDAKTKKALGDFVAARKSLPAKPPDAVKKEYANLIKEADTWAAQLNNYAAAVDKALDHSKFDQLQKELDKAKDGINDSVNMASQIKSNYFSNPRALEALAQKVADKDGDLTGRLTKLVAAASAINGLDPPDKIQ
jgi:uncharacterized phage infection (PIP) family protein YhgE